MSSQLQVVVAVEAGRGVQAVAPAVFVGDWPAEARFELDVPSDKRFELRGV
jgi:hypothetical protein